MAYKIRDQYGMNYLTFTVVDWVRCFYAYRTQKCNNWKSKTLL